jgi:mannosidase alpha-like ER degradation enhancer 1
MLEFATLSRLTGDERFEKAAYKAFFALWNRKSNIGLVGNTIDTWAGVRLFCPSDLSCVK